MKPTRPHPFFHFKKEFRPRPKLVTPRGFNWALVVVIALALALWGAAWGIVYVLATHAAHGGH